MGEVNSWKSQHGSKHSFDSNPFCSVSIRHPIPEFRLFLKIWPWKSRVKVMGAVTVQSHNVGLTSYRLASLSFHLNRPSVSWDTYFKIWPWKSRVKVKWPWCCTPTGHRTSNSINQSSGFRDMCSAMSSPCAASFYKFLVHRQAHMGQMGKWPWQYTTAGLDNSNPQNFERRKSVKRVPQV